MLRKYYKSLWTGPSMGLVVDNRTQIEYLGFSKLMMGDWDFNDGSHPVQGVTVPNRTYALGILKRDVFFRPNHCWRVYQTPAGVRAFLTSHWEEMKPAHKDLSANLQIDPIYRQCTESNGVWWSRVSPKHGRDNDFVTKYWCTVKGDKSSEHPEAMLAVQKHDQLCTRRFNPKVVLMISCVKCYQMIRWSRYGPFRGPATGCTECKGVVAKQLPLKPESLGFAREIMANPEDATPRLIFCDWLMEEEEVDDETLEMLRMTNHRLIIKQMYRRPSRESPIVGLPTDWSLVVNPFFTRRIL